MQKAAVSMKSFRLLLTAGSPRLVLPSMPFWRATDGVPIAVQRIPDCDSNVSGRAAPSQAIVADQAGRTIQLDRRFQ